MLQGRDDRLTDKPQSIVDVVVNVDMFLMLLLVLLGWGSRVGGERVWGNGRFLVLRVLMCREVRRLCRLRLVIRTSDWS